MNLSFHPVNTKSIFLTMKGLRATESHSADRAAQPKQKVDQIADLENQMKPIFFKFSKRCNENSEFSNH